MATTYYSNEITAGNPARFVEKGNFCVYAKFSLSAALVINDVIQMCKVQTGERVLNIDTYSDDLDTNVAPAITLDIGDDGDPDRFAEAVTVAQAGGFLRGIQTKAGFCYVYTADNTIDILVHAAPATGAATGDIIMVVTLAVDN